MKTHPFLALLVVGLAAAPAQAGDDCDVPLNQWQSRDAVLRRAAEQGWQVQRLKIDDGCYEIRGRDAQGREFRAKLDPKTLAPVKLKLLERDRDRERERERERDRERDRERLREPSRSHPAAASAAGAAPSASAP